MSNVLVKSETLSSIADAVRTFSGENKLLTTTEIIELISGQASLESFIKDELTQVSTSIEEMPPYCFYKKKSLLNIRFPNATVIGSSACEGCSSIETIHIPDGVTVINGGAFSSCTSLCSVTGMKNVTLLGSLAFTGTKLTVVDLPSVTSIGTQCFRNANNTHYLETLILRSPSVCTLGSTSALQGSKIADGIGYIYVPDNLVEQYKKATNWSSFAEQIKPISELPE